MRVKLINGLDLELHILEGNRQDSVHKTQKNRDTLYKNVNNIRNFGKKKKRHHFFTEQNPYNRKCSLCKEI